MSSNDIGQPNSEGSGDLAVIGEGTPNETRLSIQVLQGIYHELTGKTEDVSKSYEDPYQVDINNLNQLDHRIRQCCEQYNIKAANCSVKVFYVNDTAETFSTYERFSGFNAGSTSSVESILLTYNFLIVLPKLEKPQSYTMSIRIASRIAIEDQMRERMDFHIPKIIRTMGQRTAVVNIKYIDYAVARSILNTVDQWFEGLPKSSVPKYWKYLLKRTHYIPLFSKYFVGLLVAFFIVRSTNEFLPTDASLRDLAVFFIWTFVGLFACYKLVHHIARGAEHSIDNWSQLSYLSLTAGDKNLIKDAQSQNKTSIILGSIKFVTAILISVVAEIIIKNLA